MKYKVLEDDIIFDTYEEAIEHCIDEEWHRDDDYFEEWVNDRYDTVNICGTTYYPYDILDHFDDGNMDDALQEFMEYENEGDAENARYELRNADVGDHVEVQAYTVEVIEDNDVEEPENNYEFNIDGDTYSATDHEDILEMTRIYIEEQNLLAEMKKEKEKKDEDDLMKMFQVIGG